MSLKDKVLQSLLELDECTRRELEERLCDKAALQDDCLLWTVAADKDGYGAFQLNRTTTCRAHRVAFVLANKRLPDGLVRHTCDKPACVNPEHLVDGTPKQNTQDMIARGRRPSTAGEKNANAKLTAEDVRQIREQHAAGGISQAALGRKYKVDPSLINHIVRGRHWLCP